MTCCDVTATVSGVPIKDRAPSVKTPDTVTPNYSRVRALHWCPHCKRTKNQGLLVCWSCNTRLKRAYDGTYGPIGRIISLLDEYLFDHNESKALSWLGEA